MSEQPEPDTTELEQLRAMRRRVEDYCAVLVRRGEALAAYDLTRVLDGDAR